MKVDQNQRRRQRMLRHPRIIDLAERAHVPVDTIVDAVMPLLFILRAARSRNTAPPIPAPGASTKPPSELAEAVPGTPITIGSIAIACVLLAAPASSQTYLDPDVRGGFTLEQPDGRVTGYLRPFESYPGTAYTVTRPGGFVEGYIMPNGDGSYRFDRLPGADRHRR
jgi:hypothetical protein